jgi:hypothetical protein
MLSRTPMGRIGEPPSPLSWAFDDAKYITGQTPMSADRRPVVTVAVKED